MKTITPGRTPKRDATESNVASMLLGYVRAYLSNKWLIKISAIVIAAIALAIVVFGGMFSKKNESANNKKAPVLTVTIQAASMQLINHHLKVHGAVTAWDPLSAGATTSGLEVKSILVDEGSSVKKGQVLAILDSDQLQAQHESEKARLAASLANINKSIQPNRPEDINALQAAVMQAKANIEDQKADLVEMEANLLNANQNVSRYTYLQNEGAVSIQELESRETAAKVANANVRSAEQKVKAAQFALKQAQERLAMAEIGGRKEDIQIAHASAAEITGNIKRLQTQIDQTYIKAPADGLITRRDVHIGDISVAGKPMFWITRDHRLEMKAQIPDSDLVSVKPGQLVSIESTLAVSGKVEGKVREISPLIDPDTRLATVRIDIPMDSGLKPGIYVEGEINLGQYTTLTVPSQSIVSRDEKHTVYVLHKDQVESRNIITGNRDHDYVEVKAGLNSGESIVVDGAGFLKDGDYVAISK